MKDRKNSVGGLMLSQSQILDILEADKDRCHHGKPRGLISIGENSSKLRSLDPAMKKEIEDLSTEGNQHYDEIKSGKESQRLKQSASPHSPPIPFDGAFALHAPAVTLNFTGQESFANNSFGPNFISSSSNEDTQHPVLKHFGKHTPSRCIVPSSKSTTASSSNKVFENINSALRSTNLTSSSTTTIFYPSMMVPTTTPAAFAPSYGSSRTWPPLQSSFTTTSNYSTAEHRNRRISPRNPPSAPSLSKSFSTGGTTIAAGGEDSSHKSKSKNNNNNNNSRDVGSRRRKTFATLLHEMLTAADAEGFADIASWQPHGRAFRIHKRAEFINHVLPKMFHLTKWNSFYRQISHYGFKRINMGADEGAYYHKHFLRGHGKMASQIAVATKSTKVRKTPNPEDNPNFYEMEPVSTIMGSTDTENDHPEKNRGIQVAANVEARNHQQPADTSVTTPASLSRSSSMDRATTGEGDSSHYNTIKRSDLGGGCRRKTFATLLHEMLTAADFEGFADIASWQPHGRAFRIHKKAEFIEHVMPKKFHLTKWNSFYRQISHYGFKRINMGADEGGYYHEQFLRDHGKMASQITSATKSTKVRKTPNPEDNPNFYEMEPVSTIMGSTDTENDHPEKNRGIQVAANVEARNHQQPADTSVTTPASLSRSSSMDRATTGEGDSSHYNNIKRSDLGGGSRRKTFATLLHEMLTAADAEGFADIASWQPHGRAFRIHKKAEFIEHVMPKKFHLTKWNSFYRQISHYGFKRINMGADEGAHYHKHFLRGHGKMASQIAVATKSTKVRKTPNPEDNPNFYEMEPVSTIMGSTDTENDHPEKNRGIQVAANVEARNHQQPADTSVTTPASLSGSSSMDGTTAGGDSSHYNNIKSSDLGGSRRKTFPTLLHEILTAADLEDFADIASWQPHGRAFRIHKKAEFIDRVMPKMANVSKWCSFRRQLNRHDFKLITTGADKGGYYHEQFLRDHAKMASQIVRTPIKGTKVRKASNPEDIPNFYAMPPLRRKEFPTFLHEMLTAADDEGFVDIVSWQLHGCTFRVHKKNEFVNQIMPKMLRLSKWNSFEKQMNLYGFKQSTMGADKGAYYHKHFFRGCAKMASQIVRTAITGTKVGKDNPNVDAVPSNKQETSNRYPEKNRDISTSSKVEAPKQQQRQRQQQSDTITTTAPTTAATAPTTTLTTISSNPIKNSKNSDSPKPKMLQEQPYDNEDKGALSLEQQPYTPKKTPPLPQTVTSQPFIATTNDPHHNNPICEEFDETVTPYNGDSEYWV